MASRCQCPCNELRCVDPASFGDASEQEQVLLVAELGLVAATLDGSIGPSKTDALATALRLLPGMRGLTDSEINMIIARTGVRSQDGQRWLCETTNSIRSSPLRRLAFRMASLFSIWGGELGDPQQDYLLALACAFNFSDDEAARLFSRATGWDLSGIAPEAA